MNALFNRIGNFYLDNSRVLRQITPSDIIFINRHNPIITDEYEYQRYLDELDFNEIRINEEWLKKLKFEEIEPIDYGSSFTRIWQSENPKGLNDKLKIHQLFYYESGIENYHFEFYIGTNIQVNFETDYIHNIQAAYFLAFGTELISIDEIDYEVPEDETDDLPFA